MWCRPSPWASRVSLRAWLPLTGSSSSSSTSPILPLLMRVVHSAGSPCSSPLKSMANVRCSSSNMNGPNPSASIWAMAFSRSFTTTPTWCRRLVGNDGFSSAIVTPFGQWTRSAHSGDRRSGLTSLHDPAVIWSRIGGSRRAGSSRWPDLTIGRVTGSGTSSTSTTLMAFWTAAFSDYPLAGRLCPMSRCRRVDDRSRRPLYVRGRSPCGSASDRSARTWDPRAMGRACPSSPDRAPSGQAP